MPIYVCIVFDGTGKAVDVNSFRAPSDRRASARALTVMRNVPTSAGCEVWTAGQRIARFPEHEFQHGEA